MLQFNENKTVNNSKTVFAITAYGLCSFLMIFTLMSWTLQITFWKNAKAPPLPYVEISRGGSRSMRCVFKKDRKLNM